MKNLSLALILATRLVLVPIYSCIFGALVVIGVKLVEESVISIPLVLDMTGTDTILFVLSLVDLALVANILVMVVVGGLQYFHTSANDLHGWPAWAGAVDHGVVKLRLMAAVVSISAIEALKVFMHIADFTDRHLMWVVAIHLALVTSTLLLSVADRLGLGLRSGQAH